MKIGPVLGILAGLQLAVSLISQLAVLRILGVGNQTDAYIAAQSVPLVIGAIVTTSLQNLWLPRFSTAARSGNLENEQSLAQGQILAVLGTLSLLLIVTAPLWIQLAFPGFDTSQSGQINDLCLPLFFAAILNGQSALLTAASRAKGSFVQPELVTLGMLVGGFLLILVLVPRWGIVAAAWITLARSMLVYLLLLQRVTRPGVKFRASGSGGDSLYAQMRLMIGGTAIIKTGPLVDRYWSSQATSGGMTTLNISQLGIGALGTVMERAFLIPVVVNFGRLRQDEDWEMLRRTYLLCLLKVGISVGAVAALLLAAQPVWKQMMFAMLKVSGQGAMDMWLVCIILLPSLFVAVSGAAAVAVLYAFGENRVPIFIGLGGFGVGLLLKGLLFQRYGILGIAMGSSIYFTLNMLLYHTAVERRIRRAKKACA